MRIQSVPEGPGTGKVMNYDTSCPTCQGRTWVSDENDDDVPCPMCTVQEAPPAAEAPVPEERDPFRPPPDQEARCLAILRQLDAFLPAQPREMAPSLIGGPGTLDRIQAQEVLTAATRWKEFLKTQIGERRADALVLAAGVNWMKRHVAFAHKGKVDKLRQDQFQALQDYEYRQLLIEAEVSRLESMLDQQSAVYSAASRNLTGDIAR